MGEHSQHFPAGRTVYTEACGDTYEVPEGRVGIYSVDELKQIKVAYVDNIPYINDGADYVNLTELESGIDASKVEVFYICPNPHDGTKKTGNYCGSSDREDFQFTETWKCRDCGVHHDTEKDAESCCEYQRKNALRTPAVKLESFKPVTDLSGVSYSDLMAEFTRRGGKVTLSSDKGVEASVPEDWGL